VWLRHLWATDFRSYESVDLELTQGLTAIVGLNGAGKSNVLEAVSFLASGESFRGAQSDALIRDGCDAAVLRGEFEATGRDLLVETEITAGSRANRTQLNRQKVGRLRDLLEVLAVSVFAPEDLDLMKGSPSVRRDAIDGAIVAVTPARDQQRRDLARILKQRNALLRQSGGRLPDDVALTLDVWDQRLSEAGDAWSQNRSNLVRALNDEVRRSYVELASKPATVTVEYVPSWTGDLAGALAEGRRDDLRRGISLIGPHRDEIRFALNGLPARTHASQGEQRTLSLALRLAIHRLVATARGDTPLLLLDDVFSELDPMRSAALLKALPDGQALLTTAGGLPESANPERIVEIDGPSL
jgi:DNA replication and repair protein RecF